jgi:hypothetical protein
MQSIKNYFTIGTAEWRKTVKYCLGTGLIVGLFSGLVILLNVL